MNTYEHVTTELCLVYLARKSSFMSTYDGVTYTSSSP